MRPCGHVLAGAAGAAQAGAHFRHWKIRPQLGDQARGFNHRVMTAAVAPAENSDAGFGDFAQGRRPAPPVLSLEPSPLDCRHALPNELGLQSYMIEHNKNNWITQASRRGGCPRSGENARRCAISVLKCTPRRIETRRCRGNTGVRPVRGRRAASGSGLPNGGWDVSVGYAERIVAQRQTPRPALGRGRCHRLGGDRCPHAHLRLGRA